SLCAFKFSVLRKVFISSLLFNKTHTSCNLSSQVKHASSRYVCIVHHNTQPKNEHNLIPLPISISINPIQPITTISKRFNHHPHRNRRCPHHLPRLPLPHHLYYQVYTSPSMPPPSPRPSPVAPSQTQVPAPPS